MKVSVKFFEKFFTILLVAGWTFLSFQARAATLTDVSIILSDDTPMVSSNHTVSFKVATDSALKQIDFRWRKSVSDSTKPGNMDLTSASGAIVSGLNSELWSFNNSSSSSGILRMTSVDGEELTAGDQINFIFSDITNPEIGDCTTTGAIFDECYVDFTTYSDAGITIVDSGGISYTIRDIPEVTFSISGVAENTVTNGITTSIATSFNQINYGNLKMREARYAAQELYVKTTAPNGYVVKMKLDGYMQGLMPNNKIDPFAATNASWTTPQLWSHPYGTEANTDSGWIGANSSDHRIDDILGSGTNWTSGAGKFGPVSSTSHIVMASPGKDYGTSAYVTYAIEVNQYQPVDSYAGIIVYNVMPTY